MHELIVKVKCPYCRQSLMDEERLIDDLPSVKVYIQFNDKKGLLYLSSIYGSYNIFSETYIYLAESFMAGDPLEGGGFVILNGLKFNTKGEIIELDTPYPGGNLFSLASGGAIYIRDPHLKVETGQLNGGRFAEVTERDWEVILPYLEENEKLFDISVERLLSVDGKILSYNKVYRKVEAVELKILSGTHY